MEKLKLSNPNDLGELGKITRSFDIKPRYYSFSKGSYSINNKSIRYKSKTDSSKIK
jgi:hypothetical protein